MCRREFIWVYTPSFSGSLIVVITGSDFSASSSSSKERTSSHTADNDTLKYWLEHSVHQRVQENKLFEPLTEQQVQGVQKFLFFTGYPRSGHSIIGSFLDAHPNIALSYAFYLFRNLLKAPDKEGSMEGLLRNKTLFFNIVYERSFHYSLVSVNRKRKGYTLDVPELWSGKFDKHLKIIGDKSALPTTVGYSNSSPLYFKERYNRLQESVGVPLLGLHVVRNPFDMISTHLLYKSLKYSWKQEEKRKWSVDNKYRNDSGLEKVIAVFFDEANAVKEMVPLCGMEILEVHNEDLVKDPRKELKRMCGFLEVECSEGYLSACESKCYGKVSRTRDKVFWTPELRLLVKEKMSQYPFFRGYTFEDDYYNPTFA